MAKAVANLDDLKRLQTSVKRAESQITDAIRVLHRDLERADWHDDARRSFESKLREATSSVQRTTQKLGELQPVLQKAVRDLSAYLAR